MGQTLRVTSETSKKIKQAIQSDKYQKPVNSKNYASSSNSQTTFQEKFRFEKINSNLSAKYNYKNGKNYSYQIILQKNIQQLSNFVLEKKKGVEFSVPNIKLNRNDNVELRNRILNMTSDEIKELGINKSTLWHIKKNLSEGKIPKIYEKILLKIQ